MSHPAQESRFASGIFSSNNVIVSEISAPILSLQSQSDCPHLPCDFLELLARHLHWPAGHDAGIVGSVLTLMIVSCKGTDNRQHHLPVENVADASRDLVPGSQIFLSSTLVHVTEYVCAPTFTSHQELPLTNWTVVLRYLDHCLFVWLFCFLLVLSGSGLRTHRRPSPVRWMSSLVAPPSFLELSPPGASRSSLEPLHRNAGLHNLVWLLLLRLLLVVQFSF